MSALCAIPQGFKVDTDNRDRAASIVRLLATRPQQLFLVFGDEGGVEITLLELGNGECAAEELDVGGEANDVVVFQGHVQCLNCFLARGLLHDEL